MWRYLNYDQRILALTLLGGVPGTVVALVLLWTGGFAPKIQWTLTLVIVLCWLGFAAAVRHRVVYPLQTLANLLEALREGDYTLRGRHTLPDDALGQVVLEVNTLSSTLRQQRLDAMEATNLLATVIEELDVGVFAFDSEGRLRLSNRAGERLLAQPSDRLAGRTAMELGLMDLLEGEPRRTQQRTFPGGVGRWGIRRGSFRLDGRQHQLLVITDLSRALREEESQAWRRLIRVLGHELNNSLTPIQSMVGTLQSLISRKPRPQDWEEDADRGLALIGNRSRALGRFIRAYSRLARLPQPTLAPVAVEAWVRRTARMEGRISVVVLPGPEIPLVADADQLDQLLINLLQNAADAALEAGGGVRVSWRRTGDRLELAVEDDGPGLAGTDNLFVPFFTTKPGGTGIGLVLSQQIAEAHGGTLTLENRSDGQGCVATLSLPLSRRSSSSARPRGARKRPASR